MRLYSLLRALSSRNLRLLFAGQGISLIGTWLQQAAMSWLVYRMTGSAILLGTVSFATQIPSLILAPLAGVLATRWDLRRMLLCTQLLALLQASVLALCVLTDLVQVWHLVVLSLFVGTLNAFETPARQSFFIDLVESPADLGNAIALNSSMINAARLIGPSLAGMLVSTAGEGVCFLLNASSYLPIIAALLAIRVARRRPVRQKPRILHELKEGFGYAFGFPPIRSVLLLAALSSLAGMPFTVLLPLFAKEIFHGGAGTYGLLMAAVGIGALTGTVYLASRRSLIGLSSLLPVTMGIFGFGLLACSLSGSLPLSLLFLAVSGFGGMALGSTGNATIQSLVDDDKRTRVVSIYIMVVVGMAPFGSMLAGTLATYLGPRQTFALGGLCCLAGAILFGKKLARFHGQVLPVYQRKGLLP
jgi:MFS family permease